MLIVMVSGSESVSLNSSAAPSCIQKEQHIDTVMSKCYNFFKDNRLSFCKKRRMIHWWYNTKRRQSLWTKSQSQEYSVF